jgi:hypothetical protein
MKWAVAPWVLTPAVVIVPGPCLVTVAPSPTANDVVEKVSLPKRNRVAGDREAARGGAAGGREHEVRPRGCAGDVLVRVAIVCVAATMPSTVPGV